MPVPEEIRKVPRPKNTVCKATSNPSIYLVIERKGCRYDKGRRLPVNGSTIGHIIDGAYVPLGKGEAHGRLSTSEPSMLKYGNVAFAHAVGQSLLPELGRVFDAKDAEQIYTIALVRAAFPDLKDYRIQEEYDKSWASQLFPRAAVSKSSVSSLMSRLGANYSRLAEFMRNRVDAMAGPGMVTILDGMLKSNTSKVNSFSGFSFKSRIRGEKDIVVMVAFSADKKEPICSKAFRGSMPDYTNFVDFAEEFNIREGTVIGDKAFEFDKIEGCPSLGYVYPCKRSSRRPKDLGCYKDMSMISDCGGLLLGKKVQDEKEGVWYYAFRDTDKENKEVRDFLKRAKKKGAFDQEKFARRKELAGTVVFKSNVDFALPDVYKLYRQRWEIELAFRSYKDLLKAATTREHDDWSLVGSEFVNFLSVVMTCRMKNRIEETDLFRKYTYGEILERLRDVFKVTIDKERKTWKTRPLSKEDSTILKILTEDKTDSQNQKQKQKQKQ